MRGLLLKPRIFEVKRWLGDYPTQGQHWDVIQFNHGLHDLKQTYHATSDTFGDYAVPVADYQRNLEKEIAILKQTGAKLIWCSTTPVPNSNKGQHARRKGADEVYNRAAMEVMRKHPEIQINDLHQFISQNSAFDRWRTEKDVHYWTKDLQTLLGGAVADAIKKALHERNTTSPRQSGVRSSSEYPVFKAIATCGVDFNRTMSSRSCAPFATCQ